MLLCRAANSLTLPSKSTSSNRENKDQRGWWTTMTLARALGPWMQIRLGDTDAPPQELQNNSENTISIVFFAGSLKSKHYFPHNQPVLFFNNGNQLFVGLPSGWFFAQGTLVRPSWVSFFKECTMDNELAASKPDVGSSKNSMVGSWIFSLVHPWDITHKTKIQSQLQFWSCVFSFFWYV